MSKTIVCRDMDGNMHEVPVDELVWRPSAYCIVIKDHKILLLKQYNGYDLPGGGVDLGETTEEAVIREVQEESGVIVANPRLLVVRNSYFQFSYKAPPQTVQSLMFYYQCDYISGELSKDGHDEFEQQYAEGCEWFPIDQLDNITIGTSVDWREIIKAVIKS